MVDPLFLPSFLRSSLLSMADDDGYAASAKLGGGEGKKNSVVVKVGMVGDSQIGKTSLMVKYVEGTFDEDYIQTLGTSRHVLIFPVIANLLIIRSQA